MIYNFNGEKRNNTILIKYYTNVKSDSSSKEILTMVDLENYIYLEE